MIDWLLQMWIALLEVLQGIVSLLTLCAYRPSWTSYARIELLYWRCRRQEGDDDDLG